MIYFTYINSKENCINKIFLCNFCSIILVPALSPFSGVIKAFMFNFPVQVCHSSTRRNTQGMIFCIICDKIAQKFSVRLRNREGLGCYSNGMLGTRYID